MRCVVIGAGAAGFFGAIRCKEVNPKAEVILLEKARQVLAKVRISGGGRCNVTHHCFEPSLLLKNYPRGAKELRGPFSRFQPRDTIEWFESRGVSLKVESDGRMFPTTDNSETIIACLMEQARFAGVDLRTESGVSSIDRKEAGFVISFSDGEILECDQILIATGSSPKAYQWLSDLKHTVISPVPSLFTFNVPDSPLLGLSGISVPNAEVSLPEAGLLQTGPLLLTHFGFSGPAVLKLSAFGARFLHDKQYQTKLLINFLPSLKENTLRELIEAHRLKFASRLVSGESPFDLPKKLWKALLEMAGIPPDLRWSVFSKQHLHKLVGVLHASCFNINGKNTYKDEFVTCGGVKLSEVDFKTMESRICPGLYFAGEVLDIDGVTGGFNFQNAWTTAWLAGTAMGNVDIPNVIEKLEF